MKFSICLRARLLAIALLIAATGAGAAQDGGGRSPDAPAETSRALPGGVLGLLPRDSVTEHVLDAGGRKLAYTATAGTFTLFDGNGERSAAIYYTAYVGKTAAPEKRPVTFVFNGGPGAASAYLHLGLVGPRIVDFGEKPEAAGARLRDNPESWLAFTDLVLIDPVGTGWSRAAKPDNTSFWGVRSDASALAKVIALYVSRNGRGPSPKYLLGESYGGFRAVKTARALQSEQGMVIDGIVMASPFLEGALVFGANRFALGAALQFPSLAAARLDRDNAFTPQALAQAERFAMTDYLVTLAGPPPEGEAAARFYAQVAEFSGLPLDRVTRARGFLRDLYAKGARDGRDEIVSAYDASFAAADPYPESASQDGSDPMLDGFLQALGGAFVHYARGELGFKTDMTFNLLNREANGKWDWGGGGRAQASAVGDLREWLALNPTARLLVVHGRSDAVTPYGVSRYVLDHLPRSVADRAQLRVYKGGHMFYLDEQARREATVDAEAFYNRQP